jgi:hypothetical protein
MMQRRTKSHESARPQSCVRIGSAAEIAVIKWEPGGWWSTAMARAVFGFVVLAALCIGLGATAPAKAANWLEMNSGLSGQRYDGNLPSCEAALDTIVWRFAEKENRFWNSDLQILSFERVRETAFRPLAPGTIPRRFCSAVATVSDGLRHTVHYWIGEDTGFAGGSWGVEWCVVGLDRNWAYNPRCKMARP